MRWLLGKTGYSFLDVWSLAHLGFWIFAGSCLWAARANRLYALIGCMVVAYGWEVFERFAEKRWPNIWQSPESWWNSWLSDPLMCLIGVGGMYLLLNKWGGHVS